MARSKLRPDDVVVVARDEGVILTKATLATWRTRDPERLPFQKIAGRVYYRLTDVLRFLGVEAAEARWTMRARNVKPAFFANEGLGECSPEARLLFLGLWCLADRAGRLEDRPRRIAAQLFPYGLTTDCESLLNELESKREPDGTFSFIVRYEVEGMRFIEVLNFSKHQHCHMREPMSTIPARCQPGASPVPARCQPGASIGRAPVRPG